MQSRLPAMIALSISVLTWNPSGVAAQQKQEQGKGQKKAPDSKAQRASLTGCVDQQDGQYVLIQDQTRALIANLEAEGFPTEGFAKHVGHKVTVRGTSNGAERPTFKVRSIETVSEGCGPQQD